MNIQKSQSYRCTPSFGTYLGINLQDKILLARQRNIFTKEQLTNLEKIENDGLEVFMDIAKKYMIHPNKQGKSFMKGHQYLVLGNEVKNTVIANIDHIFRDIGNNKAVFLMHKFTHLFDDSFALADKIKTAWDTVLNNSH